MATRNQPKKNTTLYEEKYNSKKELYYQTYEVGRALGKGGFAHVYEVQQKNKPGVNAIKMISKSDKQGKQDPVYLQKIRSEIKIMQVACQNSDQMVKYLHSFTDNDYVYIIMELCPLGSLNDMVKRRKTLTEPEVRYFILQMIHILIALKEKKIIHRDIKLANLFVSSNYKLKLGDFGLATFYNEEFRNKRGVCGTPNYIAPEVIEKKEYAFEVDLWATGVIMFTMLLGVPPFETKSCKETYDRIKSCSFKFQGFRNIKISDEAKMLIKDILLHDPKQRITPSQMLNHPFLNYFPIPPALQPECYKSCPSYSFLKKFSTPIVKAQQPESIAKPQNNETTLQKKDKDKPKQLYRNIKVQNRKTQEVKSSRSPAKIKEEVKVKEEPCVKTETSRPSRLDVSISIKNRDNSQREDILAPNKRFKHNFQQINQNSERDLTATMVKQPFHTSAEYLGVDLTLADKNLLHILNKKHNVLARYRQLPKSKPRLEDEGDRVQDGGGQRVVWYEISEGNGLVYRLSGGGLGAIFPEGSKMLLSNISKIEYAERGQNRINDEPSANNLCISDQVEYLNYQYLKLTCGDCRLQPISGRESIFVKGYLQLKEAVVFSLSNQDLQLMLEDGCSLTLKPQAQQLIYHHGDKQIIQTLPISRTSITNNFCQEKIDKGFFLLQKLGCQVLVEKERKMRWRVRWGDGEREGASKGVREAAGVRVRLLRQPAG